MLIEIWLHFLWRGNEGYYWLNERNVINTFFLTLTLLFIEIHVDLIALCEELCYLSRKQMSRMYSEEYTAVGS